MTGLTLRHLSSIVEIFEVPGTRSVLTLPSIASTTVTDEPSQSVHTSIAVEIASSFVHTSSCMFSCGASGFSAHVKIGNFNIFIVYLQFTTSSTQTDRQTQRRNGLKYRACITAEFDVLVPRWVGRCH